MTTGRHGSRLTVWVAIVVAIGALLTACKPARPTVTSSGTPATPAAAAGARAGRVPPIGATASVDAAAWALADRLSGPNYRPDTTTAAITALAAAGVGTYTDPDAESPDLPLTGPASPMRLLDFQAHALAVGAWAGAGYTGAELDGTVPLPPNATGTPTTSQLIAAYVAAVDSPGAALSRALMAGQNLLAPAAARFPALVLVLFASDLATSAGQPAATDQQARLAPRDAVLAGGACSKGAGWISDMVHTFFAALKVDTPANLAGAVVVSIWNWLVDRGEALVRGLAKTVTDAILGTIRGIVNAVSIVAEEIASILPYAVKVSDDQGAYLLGPQPQAGTFTATVTAGDLPEWPALLSDCAELAGFALPNFHPEGTPVTWEPLGTTGDPLVTLDPVTTPSVIDAGGRATRGFVTATDPGDPRGQTLVQIDSEPVVVHRPEIDKVRKRLTDALFGWVGPTLRPYVDALMAPYVDGLQNRLNQLLDARGTGDVVLIYHSEAPPKSKPSATAATCVAPGTYTGTDTNTFVEKLAFDGGGFADRNDGTGAVTLVVAADGSATGTWAYRMHEVFDENIGDTVADHRETTWAMTAGAITGTACDLTLTPGTLRRLTCTDSMGACHDSSRAPVQGSIPSLGRPVSVVGGRVTWRRVIDDSSNGTTDTFTMTVTRSSG